LKNYKEIKMHPFEGTPTPKEIVKELDKYIIGQTEAKKMVAIALRNRARRKQLPESLRDEVAPKNIIMIGPTGVGKTEIARRLAKLSDAPFIKVEASKFTEVGYVGRDVESIIRDLVTLSVNNLKKERMKEVRAKAEKNVEEQLLDLLFPSKKTNETNHEKSVLSSDNMSVSLPDEAKSQQDEERHLKTREKIRQKLKKGEFEESYVEIKVQEQNIPFVELFTNAGFDPGELTGGGFAGIFPKKSKKRKMQVKDARKYLVDEESEKLIDKDKVIMDAVERTENMGIVFIDEIDKIADAKSSSSADVSRQGVQRDLLPLVEGTAVMTKYGVVNTNHILFIASGAFHVSKPSDLIPELQGRFPIRVELDSLTTSDFRQILVKPKNALTKQYIALLDTEGIKITFQKTGIDRIAELSAQVNSKTENIGARRLHTIVEKVLEEVSFNAPDLKEKEILIDQKYVDERLTDIIKDVDLSRYIL